MPVVTNNLSRHSSGLFPPPSPMRTVLSLLSISLLACSCSDNDTATSSAPVSKPVPVTVTKVERQPFTDTTVAIGNLRSEESVEITANVTERIDSLHFEDGEYVREGQILAELSKSEETAMLSVAQSELKEQQREIERLQNLTRQNAVAEVTLDERFTQRDMAQGKIEQISSMLRDLTITAPFNGIIGLRRISPGALVEPGTVITTVDKIEKMKLDFPVPEVFLNDLKPGTRVEAKSPAFPDDIFEAEIATVDSRVDPVTRSIEVRAILHNKDRTLRPGMLMTVSLQRNDREALALPERAIVPFGNKHSVYVVNEDNTVRLADVELGVRRPGYVEVTNGLTEGTTVVTDGILSLSNGATVEVAGEFDGPAPAFDPTNQAAE